jgi:serine/threonine-protein kinase
MPRDAGAGDRSFDIERDRLIHRLCEQFEREWRSENRPSVEHFLTHADAGARGALLEELVILELELRRTAGENPALSEYLKRFPDDARHVSAAYSLSADTVQPVEARGDSPVVTPTNADLETPTLLPPRMAGQAMHAPCPPPIESVGEYVVLAEIARGGMGIVFKAHDKRLKRTVAIKMMLSGQMATEEERERFRREAELAANLDHANIVPIFEVAEHQGCPFFSMKYIDGESLSKRIKRRQSGDSAYSPAAAARLICSIARAVQYAHEKGFLHCDLKPSNILLDRDGRPLITDFGLARRTNVDSSLTISGAILGTPSYMAPEQATGSRKQLTEKTDVYGLGAILYELLTGRAPFRRETIMETVMDVLERDPAAPRELRPDVPPELETICLRCLEKAPADRYPSAAALADEVEKFLQGEMIDATSVIPRLKRWNRREPELVSRLVGLVLIGLISQFNYFFVSTDRSLWMHLQVQGVLALWAISAVSFQALLRIGWRSDHVRILWSAADILCLTLELKLFEQVEPSGVVRFRTTLLVGYPLMIAASGLWWRVHLVWITTALATASFLWLYLDAAIAWNGGHVAWRPRPSPDLQFANIFAAALVLTGFVVARQVKRILLLSQYYEQRPPN